MVILWPLISTYSASGEASILNLLDLKRIRPCDRPYQLALKEDVARRARPEQDRMVALELEKLDAAFFIVDFQGGHAGRTHFLSWDTSPQGILSDDLKIIAVAAGNDGKSRDADFAGLPPLERTSSSASRCSTPRGKTEKRHFRRLVTPALPSSAMSDSFRPRPCHRKYSR